MIDIHAHILPGIDDGPDDIYDSLDMARIAAQSGVRYIVATPHCNLPGRYKNYFGNSYVELFERTSKRIQEENIPIKLLPGMEAYATDDLPDLIVAGKIMPLNQSRYILIEFDFNEDPDFANDILSRVAAVGAIPVIAHAERYNFIQDNTALLDNWIANNYIIQANKSSFMGRFGQHVQNTVEYMWKHNLMHIVASDAHGVIHRTTDLKETYLLLSKYSPPKKVNDAFRNYAAKILF